MENEDKICDMAQRACFYVTPEGLWLRMDYTDSDEGSFWCHDEESGEEYSIPFAEVTFEGSECFWELTRMAAPQFDNKTGDLFA
jgi:hypothetical protein